MDDAPLIAKCSCMRSVIKNIKSLKAAHTFSLIGTKSCGKKFLARHFIKLFNKIEYFIDCENENIDFKQLQNLSQNTEHKTFIINHPEKLTYEKQLQLANIINATIGASAKQWIHIIDIKEESNLHKDLYERTSLFRIIIPNLKDRTEDIPYLAKIMQKKLAKIINKKLYKLDIDYISSQAWENNFKELKQYIEQMFFIEHVKDEEEEIILDQIFFSMHLKEAKKLFESVYLKKQLKDKTYKLTAQKCNIDRTTLYRKLKKLAKNFRENLALKNDEHDQTLEEVKTEP